MIRHLHRTSAAFLSMAALAACASGGTSSGRSAAATPATQQAAGSSIPINLMQWTGSFRSAQQITSNVGSGHTTVTGGVRLTASGAGAMHAHVTLSTNAGIADATPLHWAIAQGDCHDGALPMIPLTSFPDLTISNDRGELDAEVPIELPTSGRYHANVYWRDSADEADVLTCATLDLSKIK